MADWTKKITKAVGDDLEAGETLLSGIFLQPAGETTRAVSRGVGGALGSMIAKRRQDNADDGDGLRSDEGLAAQFTDEPLVVGLTDRRVLVWGHSTMSGKPKGLKFTFPADQLTDLEIEKQKATYAVVMSFADGSGVVREAPRVGNKPTAFLDAFTGRLR